MMEDLVKLREEYWNMSRDEKEFYYKGKIYNIFERAEKYQLDELKEIFSREEADEDIFEEDIMKALKKTSHQISEGILRLNKDLGVYNKGQ